MDGLTASSPGSGSSSGSNSGGGAGSGSVHTGGTAGILREEIQETLTSEYFQICKVSFWIGLTPIISSFYCCKERRVKQQKKTHQGLEIVEMPESESGAGNSVDRSVWINKDIIGINFSINFKAMAILVKGEIGKQKK